MIQAWAPTTPNVMALNSAGLERLGIDAEHARPGRPGEIEKDAGGEPTGLLSGSVNNYYSNEPFTEELMRAAARCSIRPRSVPAPSARCAAYNAMGVTCAYEGHAMDFPLIAAYQWLRGEERLTMRVLCAPEAEPYGLPWNEEPSDEEFARAPRAGGGDGRSARTTCCGSTGSRSGAAVPAGRASS